MQPTPADMIVGVPTVDAHAHVFSSAEGRTLKRAPGKPAPPSAEIDNYLSAMDQAGVDHAVLIPLGADSSYVRSCVQQYPRRFVGVCVYNHPAAPSVDWLHRELDGGMHGMRLFDVGAIGGTGIESAAVFPLLDEMAQHGKKLWLYPRREQLDLAIRIAEALPSLQIVLNHLGLCSDAQKYDQKWDERVLEFAKVPNAHVMISGQYAFSQREYPYDDLREVVTRVYESFGHERMLWASDFPWILESTGYQAQLDLVDTYLSTIDPAQRSAIKGGNAARLFGFPAQIATV